MGCVLNPITRADVSYICWNMRDIDKAEVYGLRGHTNPGLLTTEVIHAASVGKAGICYWNGRPAALIGISPLWPGVWTAWSFGTDDWSRCAGRLTRYALRELQPHVRERAHRLQCESRFDHTEAHKWLLRIGAQIDGQMPGYGRDGSDYIMFSWRK